MMPANWSPEKGQFWGELPDQFAWPAGTPKGKCWRRQGSMILPCYIVDALSGSNHCAGKPMPSDPPVILRRGAKFDVAAMRAAIPQMRDQYRAHLDWIESQLADQGDWLCGGLPGLLDINAYMNVWYVRSNLPVADELLKGFSKVHDWEQRMRAIGHGTGVEMSSADALKLARDSTPQTAVMSDALDPNGRKAGDLVDVTPDDYGKVPVRGRIVASSAQTIAIARHEEVAGDIVVHFPRAGFLVTPVAV
jgi:hypothetical protein